MFFVTPARAGTHPRAGTLGPVPTVGILEFVNDGISRKELSQARLGFFFDHSGGSWQAIDLRTDSEKELRKAVEKVPKSAEWDVCFDGKTLAHIQTHRPLKYLHYGDVGTHLLTGLAPSSTKVGKEDSEFSGSFAQTSHRPLILSTSARCADPDGWHRLVLDSASTAKLIVTVDGTLGALMKVRTKNQEGAIYSFKQKDIGIAKAYEDKAGRRIIFASISVDKGAKQYEAFAEVHKGEQHFVGSDLTMVDAADLDGDGHSEIVLKVHDYNYDGYWLLQSDLSRPAKIAWSYQ